MGWRFTTWPLRKNRCATAAVPSRLTVTSMSELHVALVTLASTLGGSGNGGVLSTHAIPASNQETGSAYDVHLMSPPRRGPSLPPFYSGRGAGRWGSHGSRNAMAHRAMSVHPDTRERHTPAGRVG